MALVWKPFDDGFVEVEEEWLERARELLRKHGITDVQKILETLEEQMEVEPFDDHVSDIVVIAMRETLSERELSELIQPAAPITPLPGNPSARVGP